MEIIETKIKDLLIIKPDVFIDERGYFFESYNKERFMEHGLDMTFVQDNESQSMQGVLRRKQQADVLDSGRLRTWLRLPRRPFGVYLQMH